MTSLFKTNANYDPTHTTMVRRAYERELSKRFRELKRRIIRALLGPKPLRTNANDFDFVRDPNRASAFIKWVKQQSDFTILRGPTMTSQMRSWQDVYISSAYQRGLASAAKNLKGQGVEVSDRWIDSAFFQPVHADRAGLIYTRAFAELEGVTQAMATKMSQSIASGVIEGKGMRQIARELVRDVNGIGLTRARMIARTEVISAHAEASLNAYTEAGVQGVKVLAEFQTAGDSKVCPRCQALEDMPPTTIEKAQGMIPVHPNCRCAWLPVVQEPTKIRGLR
jgi:SPP1 gp7 family putative phage head morphogenesis protein